MTIRAIRGATTLDVDEREHLHERTNELVGAMLRENGLTTDDAGLRVLHLHARHSRGLSAAAAARTSASATCL